MSEQERYKRGRPVTEVAVRGTQASGKYDQDWHDKNFKKNIEAVGSKYGKDSPYNDRAVSQQMLKQGADPKKLANSIEKHSPNFKNGEDRRKGANKIVTSAMKKNAQDVPRSDRVRQKPSHQVAEARNTSNVMSSYNSKSNAEYQARIKQMEHMKNHRTR